MNNFPIQIKIRKEIMQLNFDDNKDTTIGGVRVILGPKLEKFISLENLTTGRKSNLELLQYVNSDLYTWYITRDNGAELLLSSSEQKKITVKEIYSGTNEENEL